MDHHPSEVLSCCCTSLMNDKMLSWFTLYYLLLLLETKSYHSSVKYGYLTSACRGLNHTDFFYSEIISKSMAVGLNITVYNI